MSSISYTTSTQTMGDASDSDGAKWAAYIETRLSEQFPGADIDVSENNRLSASVLRVSEDLDRDEVDGFIQEVWNRELDKALA